MKKIRITLLTLVILINSIFATGCWNYKEIDELAIVAGVAVDKGINNQFKVTVETIQISTGKDTKMTSKMITMEGKTMMDAVRNIVSVSGKKLYWSHSKVIIISKEIASEGITKVVDWYNRDSETRPDVNMLISGEASAKEIFDGQSPTEDIKSFTLAYIIKNQVILSKAPNTTILQYSLVLHSKGISAVLPVVTLEQIGVKNTPQIMGTAIFKKDKLVGFLNGEATKDLIFIKNEIKGGILTEEAQSADKPILISLEIFKNKTKVTPVVDGKDIEIKLNIDTTVAIDEIEGKVEFFDDEAQIKLEQNAANMLKERIEALIKKVQTEYDTDIFGFGTKLYEDKVQAWNNVGNNWDEVFKDLKVTVKTNVHIKNSAMLSKSFGEGE